MEPLEERVTRIEERNTSVELDKAWETSWARGSLVIAFTYVAIGALLSAIHVDRPWLAALVPAAAFFISTLTMPYFKAQWIARKKSATRP